MSGLSQHQADVAELLVNSLHPEDIRPEDINLDEPLFNDGLGLDSIDALELAMAVSKKYGFQLRSDDPENKKIFSSLRALAEHIASNQQS